MSDQSPPAKPKQPGSLRDRIAAFENPTSSAQGPPPVPRPKPGGLSWKPKPSSPPSSPRSSVDHSDAPEKKSGGMSASDAKESIGKGGSLKERMALLQGRGAFGGAPGASPPPAPPKPASEKPKWKPPPRIVSPPPAEKNDREIGADVGRQSPRPSTAARSPEPEESTKPSDAEEPIGSTETEEGNASAEADPEEEERQRRAALAARMARLGGARVGMAPPIFGRKPSVKKVETPKEDTPEEVSKDEEAKSVEPQPSGEQPLVQSPPAQATPEVIATDYAEGVEPKPDYFGGNSARKDSASSSLLSADSSSTQPSRSPSSMPVPAGPRRAGPPRKKAVKSPSPSPVPPILGDGINESPESMLTPDAVTGAPGVKLMEEAKSEALYVISKEQGDMEREIGEVDKEADPGTLSMPPTELEEAPLAAEHPEAAREDDIPAPDFGPDVTSAGVEDTYEAAETNQTAEPDILEPESEEATIPIVAPTPISVSVPLESEEVFANESIEPVPHVQEAVEEEEDEATRRKRVAERLAKMGGFNPFAAAPGLARRPSSNSPSPSADRRDSVGSDSPFVSPPLPDPQRRGSLRRSSGGSSATASPTSATFDRGDVTRKSSVGPTHRPPVRRESRPPMSPPPVSPHVELSASVEATKPIAPIYVEEPGLEAESQDQDDLSEPSLDEQRISRQVEEPDVIENETAPVAAGESRDENEADAGRDREAEGDVASTAQLADSELEDTPAIDNVLRRSESQEIPLDDDDDDEMAPPRVTRPLPPMPPPIPSATRPSFVSADSDSAIPVRPPVPSTAGMRRSMPPPPRVVPTSPEDDSFEGRKAVPSPRSSHRSIPPPPPPEEQELEIYEAPAEDVTPKSDEHAEFDKAEDHSGSEEAIPTPPPRTSIPPPRRRSSGREGLIAKEATSTPSAPSLPAPRRSVPLIQTTDAPKENDPTDGEVLDESEGDPIDPAFHSPRRSPENSSLSSGPSPVEDPIIEEAPAEAEEDAEQGRRRTIAERMAKLGGIKFGAAPLPMSRPPPPQRVEETPADQPETPGQEDRSSDVEVTEEEEEQARKQRIAAKLAGMGGMRFGMIPPSMGGGQPHMQGRFRREDSDETVSSPPPQRAVPPPARPPPPPQPSDTDSEFESLGTSDDGVKVEAEESELEEVQYEEAQEEAPPPIPVRIGGRASGSRSVSRSSEPQSATSPTTSGRPPVPTIPPVRRASAQEATKPSAGFGTSARLPPAAPQPTAEYVMVEEPESEEPPPPPPPRSARGRPPARGAPPDPPLETHDSTTSPWELPSIPTAPLDFGGGSGDLSLSTWSEDSTSYPPPSEPSPLPVQPPQRRSSQIPPHIPSSKPPAELQLSSEELMTVWGKVGVHICEVATTLYEKSKRSLVGDGSYAGFVNAVLSQVLNAQLPAPPSYGYLVYAQTAASVQRRASDILPGDIVALYDAKLKGHKGLQTYHQNVGAGEPLIGIVSEFETKKSKIKVFEANQHVGQQTVESVSYRLEDLKSGTVKIFRVLEA